MSEKRERQKCQCYLVDKKEEDPTHVFHNEQPCLVKEKIHMVVKGQVR